MDDFFKQLNQRLLEMKRGLESEIRNDEFLDSDFKKTKFENNSVLIRQITSKTKEEAEKFDLSKEEGIKNTLEIKQKEERIKRCLIL